MSVQVEIITDKKTGERFRRLGASANFYTSNVVVLKPESRSDITESENLIVVYPEDLKVRFNVEKVNT